MKKLTEMDDPDKEKWNTEKMREHRSNWSLAADTQLLYYMQQFSQNLLSETHSTLKDVDSLESQVATTCVEVNNLASRFWALSDTQFVENRVYDDDDIASPTLPKVEPEEVKETVVINRLKEALQNGFQVLDSKFEMIEVPVSDSDDDDSTPHSGVVLKPVNRYKDRPLPHLIGSAEFRSDDTLGLRDPPSDEETDDFMSASDKAYDECEDSDVESDQTKSQDLPEQNEDNIMKPSVLIPPKLMETPITPSSVLIGDMFGESEKDLFGTQPANKNPLFSTWQQPSDLWTPDEDTQKICDDHPTTHRPPSVASSVSSAQSSNISEPVLKNIEDFGKSGSGRMPVFVQEDQNDLFSSSSEATQKPQSKKPIPAGGIKIFQGDFNPFPNLNRSRDELSEGSEHSQNSRWEDDDENDLFAKSHNTPSISLPKSSLPSSKLPQQKDDLFNDESEDLFSNSDTMKSNKPKLGDIITKGGPNTSVITNKPLPIISKNDPPQRKSLLFGDPAGESEEEDDLFSSKSTFFSSKSHDLFSDDTFMSDSKDIFSDLEIPKNTKSVKSTAVNKEVDSLFSNKKSSNQPITSERPFKDKIEKGFSSNEVDIFGDTGFTEDSLFGSSNISKQVGNQSVGKMPNVTQPHTNNLLKSKIWESEDDDLFSNTSVPSTKSTSDAELSVNSKNNSDMPKDDLFSSRKLPDTHTKGKLDVSKLRKGIETKSLFESDSDDDLFSSPQGSLSSRKSVMASATVGHKDKQKPRTIDREDVPKRSKTDFSSIFSNDSNEHSNLRTDGDILANKKHNLFEDHNNLFSSSNDDIKTPDLFKVYSKTTPQLKESFGLSDGNHKENENVTTEAINPNVVSSVEKQEPDSKIKSIFLDDSDLFEDSTVKNLEVVTVKKTEPPKTLAIKPILDNLPSNKLLSEDKNVLERNQKPSYESVEEHSDAPDGDISVTSSVSKTVPGKLKSSQLIKINPAALLPGAKPQPKGERTPESEVQTNVMDGSQVSSSSKTDSSVPLHSSKSDSSISRQEDSMPTSSCGLLLNVTKERAKIQGKRRPSSRRARKEAIRASSIETGEERTNLPPPSSNMMSPSTDEEDLFSVPPLDVITDGAKTVSPKTDIFGTPTVLSPVVKELPSSFVSTPFISSQPPPLDDEEDVAAQDDDMFGYEDNNLFVTSVKEKKPLHNVREAVNVDIEKDLFGNIDEDSLFSDIREAPPPLIIDEDDEDSDSKFVVSNDKSIASETYKGSDRVEASSSSLFFDINPPKLLDDDSLPSTHSREPDSLFSTVLKNPPDNPISKIEVVASSVDLFPSDKLQSSLDDALFGSPISTKRVGSSSSLGHIARHEDSLISEGIKHCDQEKKENPPNESTDSVNKTDLNCDGLFTEQDLFSSKVTGSKILSSTGSSTNIKPTESVSAKDYDIKSSIMVEHQNITQCKTLEEKLTSKKDTLFDDDDDGSSSLFLSGTSKLGKSESSLRPSLFGDDDDDDDSSIFGPSNLTSKNSSSTKTSQGLTNVVSQTKSGTIQTRTRSRVSGSLKPVKLETKETFSDPLLSYKD